MTYRPKKLTIRLSEQEKIYVRKQAELAGLLLEPYCRMVLMDKEVKPKPPEDITMLLKEINAIGNNINQLAHRANRSGIVSKEDVESLRQLQYQIWLKVKAL